MEIEKLSEYDKAFYGRVKKLESFKTDLKSVIEKYGFAVSVSDQYDGEENHCGIIRYFVIDGEPLYVNSIDEILKEVGLI